VTLVAGVDVGNTTTEVVVAELAGGSLRPVAWDRAPTRSVKGSPASLHGAAVLLRRLERRLQASAEVVAAAPLRPVRTSSTSLAQPRTATGRLEVVPVGGATPGGTGVGVGVPVWITAEPVLATPVVLLVPRGTGYRIAVARARAWLDAGAQVQALLLADDEGVLVSARLPAGPVAGGWLPVADEVEVDRLAGAPRVAVEVRPPGHRLRDLADPIRLSWLLGLEDAERADAVAVAEGLGAAARAVVALRSVRAEPAPAAGGWLALRGLARRSPLTAGVGGPLHAEPVGAVVAWSAGGGADQLVDDLWLVELGEVASSVAARVDPSTARSLVVAALTSGSESVDPGSVLASELGREVRVVSSEAAAARAGAATTPGVRSSSTVVDLGGGTIDVVAADGREIVAAGAGELLTVAVATFLDLPRGAADWVKRGPSSRLEAPQVLLSEDGERSFLDRPAPSVAVGSLVVAGPAGLLPFGGRLAPAEWRALRLRTKQRVLAENVVRALGSLAAPPGDVLLVGGAAADTELVGLLGPLLPGAAVGRGDVAGTLGHRYAVAYGLALLAVS
jgi:Diol dehydratase reactivase ATPase-like domain/DD-reactivating factor swiveling domain